MFRGEGFSVETDTHTHTLSHTHIHTHKHTHTHTHIHTHTHHNTLHACNSGLGIFSTVERCYFLKKRQFRRNVKVAEEDKYLTL